MSSRCGVLGRSVQTRASPSALAVTTRAPSGPIDASSMPGSELDGGELATAGRVPDVDGVVPGQEQPGRVAAKRKLVQLAGERIRRHRDFPPGESQIHAWPSLSSVAIRAPSALIAALTIPRPCFSTATGAPVVASHTRAVPSTLAVTTRLPSRLNTALSTGAPCKRGKGAFGSTVSRAISAPLRASQIPARPNDCTAVTTREPSRFSAADVTAESWRSGGPRASPVPAFHSRAVRSSLAVTTSSPSRAERGGVDLSPWRSAIGGGGAAATCQIHAVWSSRPQKRAPSRTSPQLVDRARVDAAAA